MITADKNGNPLPPADPRLVALSRLPGAVKRRQALEELDELRQMIERDEVVICLVDHGANTEELQIHAQRTYALYIGYRRKP